MMKDGKYAVWFRTPRGQGTGIVHLAGGRITGGDSFFTYTGSYQFDEQRFTAVLATRRHTEGAPTLFGPDEVEVELSGACTGAIAICTGTARQVPDVTFEATLIYNQDDVPAPTARCAVLNLNDKFPRGLDGRSRPGHVPASSRPLAP